jgi:hypothetical protein
MNTEKVRIWKAAAVISLKVAEGEENDEYIWPGRSVSAENKVECHL